MQRGDADDEEKPQNASLLKGMQPEDVTLDVALKLLVAAADAWASIRRPAQPVVAYNGRYGPYVKCGEETRSLPAGLSPLDVTLEQALELAGPAEEQRRGRGAAKEPLKVFEASPVTSKPVQLLAGALRALRDRRRDQRLAAPRHRAGGDHVRIRPESLEGPGGAGPRQAARAPPGEEGRRREEGGGAEGQESGEEDGEENVG